MTKEELWELYPPRKCKNQVEYDALINDINERQNTLNHPFLDRDRELLKQKDLIFTQIEALRIQARAIRSEILDNEQKRKDLNRLFHTLKHELIKLNPKGLKNEP